MPIDTSAQRTWEAALGRLQLQITRPSFDTWLRGTVGLALDDDTLVVGVPTPFAAEWLERRMNGLIESAVAAVAPRPLQVAFQVGHAVVEATAPQRTEPAPETIPVRASAAAPSTTLNPRYSFASFVVGESNQLAYASAMAVADSPGRTYNPLFLYGSVGLGKTHLLQAIGLRARGGGQAVCYVTCEQFTNDYLSAIRDRRTEGFRQRYRTVDLLLIDDIQFLCGKEGTQDAFFHTFNALHDAGKQIVLTCDRIPAALPLLDERLRSRLEWGLLADVALPTLDTRIHILANLSSQAAVAVPDDVLHFLANRAPTNIRQLEGSLNRVTALAHFTSTPVTLDLATRALGTNMAANDATASSPKAIIAAVAAHYGLTQAALVSGRRDKPVAAARQLAMYLLNERLRLVPAEIGEILGGRDRTTVLYSIKRITLRLRVDVPFAEEVDALRHLPTSSNSPAASVNTTHQHASPRPSP